MSKTQQNVSGRTPSPTAWVEPPLLSPTSQVEPPPQTQLEPYLLPHNPERTPAGLDVHDTFQKL